MSDSIKTLSNLLDEIGEISSNYRPYKVENLNNFYKTYQSFSFNQNNDLIEFGLNVAREKSTNHMKLIELHERTSVHHYVIIIDLLTPKVERLEIIDNGNSLKNLGILSLEELIAYLSAAIDIFKFTLETYNN
ncbi:hypothetical protein PMZ65_10580 [Clostridium perfringens]|uniref:hypothetical protein n=1 Tax=Clostridium perfringens TaxID=1502 RepID=UPI0018AAD909|nr:hypothetical protein [Clostridium perfringens]MDB2069695.1 hypothetical protein [Clostridium perfringens]MDK0898085.1 hypothetical protein [Clostridium perfringens]MDM0903138.1 hypothetical protein [Clostridium perfringens]MDU1686066.1 hypothetical protein [Clostridium perfringens]MDU1809896.1 hypothetical protein [Clostridium perfringens]